jgi:hypothetical protein
VKSDVGFEVLTAVVMNVPVFWDIVLCSPYVNHRSEGTCYFQLQGRKSAKQYAAIGRLLIMKM